MPSPSLKCRNSAISTTVATLESPTLLGDFRPYSLMEKLGGRNEWRRERNWDRTFSGYSIVGQRSWADWVRSHARPQPSPRVQRLRNGHSAPRRPLAAKIRAGCRATTSKLWPMPPSADRGPLPQLKGGDAEYPLQTQPRDRAGIRPGVQNHCRERALRP
jgi:hypothetical protein